MSGVPAKGGTGFPADAGGDGALKMEVTAVPADREQEALQTRGTGGPEEGGAGVPAEGSDMRRGHRAEGSLQAGGRAGGSAERGDKGDGGPYRTGSLQTCPSQANLLLPLCCHRTGAAPGLSCSGGCTEPPRHGGRQGLPAAPLWPPAPASPRARRQPPRQLTGYGSAALSATRQRTLGGRHLAAPAWNLQAVLMH